MIRTVYRNIDIWIHLTNWKKLFERKNYIYDVGLHYEFLILNGL